MAGEAHEEYRVLRVLAIDDDQATLTILRRILEHEHCDVDTAPTGKAALRRLLDSTYDVIISDIHMPDMDGPKLFRFLEDHMPQYKTRVLFLTGDTSSQETRAFLETAHCPVCFKPINIPDLHAKMEQVLKQDEEAQHLLAEQVVQHGERLAELQEHTDHRARRRVTMDAPIRIRVDLPEAKWLDVTHTINVSRDGVSFLSEQPYKPHMDVFVCFPYTGQGDMEQRATVVRVTALPDKGYAVGIRLSNIFLSATERHKT